MPQTPQDLEHHRCIRFCFPTSGRLQEWSIRDAAETGLRLPTALTCNNMEALRVTGVEGFGIAYAPDFLDGEAIASGALRTLLEAHLVNPGHFWILWPSSRHLSRKVRVFVDFVCERLFRE